MKLTPKILFNLVKQSGSEWIDDKAVSKAAALSYYTIFSIAPVLLIAVAVAGFIFGAEAAQGQIRDQIQGMVGKPGAQVIESMMASAHRPAAGLIATVVGVVVLLFGASGVFVELQDTLNTIWKAKPPQKSGIISTIRQRFLSFAMVLSIGFLLLVSLLLSAGLSAVGNYVNSIIPGWEVLVQIANLGISFGVITLLFAMMYKVLPDTSVKWRDVWLGAGVTAFLFAIGKFGIGLYLGKSSAASSYGAAGSIAVLLIWVNYASMILFFGAEFTQVFSRREELIGADGRVKPQKEKLPVGLKAKDESRNHPVASAEDEDNPPQSTWLPH